MRACTMVLGNQMEWMRLSHLSIRISLTCWLPIGHLFFSQINLLTTVLIRIHDILI